VLQMAKNYRNKIKQSVILMMEVTNRITQPMASGDLSKITQ